MLMILISGLMAGPRGPCTDRDRVARDRRLVGVGALAAE